MNSISAVTLEIVYIFIKATPSSSAVTLIAITSYPIQPKPISQ
ncbi:hypothetical protein MtrunA17_Chr1g0209371 [Medicago truncatula]|uniref:Uncharacterized protein n=1 Tax=Medicago truncatula TaxID=3880 RepID=A0A396K3R2_MEDTR|nr:hypothetical protein MtrunA17_Chr1g0209371 [Medicago truncatula]